MLDIFLYYFVAFFTIRGRFSFFLCLDSISIKLVKSSDSLNSIFIGLISTSIFNYFLLCFSDFFSDSNISLSSFFLEAEIFKNDTSNSSLFFFEKNRIYLMKFIISSFLCAVSLIWEFNILMTRFHFYFYCFFIFLIRYFASSLPSISGCKLFSSIFC